MTPVNGIFMAVIIMSQSQVKLSLRTNTLFGSFLKIKYEVAYVFTFQTLQMTFSKYFLVMSPKRQSKSLFTDLHIRADQQRQLRNPRKSSWRWGITVFRIRRTPKFLKFQRT